MTDSVLVSGNDEFLEPYRYGQASVGPALEQIAKLTSDNPEQQARVRDLQLLVSAQAAHWHTVLRDRDDKGFEAAQLVIKTGTGKRGMDNLRALARAMTDEELRLLRSRLRNGRMRRRQMPHRDARDGT